jgi:hypothetical protein
MTLDEAHQELKSGRIVFRQGWLFAISPIRPKWIIPLGKARSMPVFIVPYGAEWLVRIWWPTDEVQSAQDWEVFGHFERSHLFDPVHSPMRGG